MASKKKPKTRKRKKPDVAKKTRKTGSNTKIILPVGALILVAIIAVAYLALPGEEPPGYVESFNGTDYKCEGCNVVIILLDAARFDHMGYAGYERNTTPAIDEFASEAVVFSNAFSQSPWTKGSVASLFTSQYPHIHGSIETHDLLPEKALTIAEVLSQNGYNTLGVIHNTFLYPHYNLDQGFDFYKADSGTADQLTELALIKMKQTEDPFFAYLHYIDPHHPYDPPEDYRLLWADPDYKDHFKLTLDLDTVNVWHIRNMYKKGVLTEADTQFLVDAYDGEIRFADDNIRKVFDYLKESGKWDNTLIVLTADHGQEFFEHGSSEHGHTVYNELLHIPLVIYNPKVGAGEVKTQVRHIDVLPTILDALDIPIPEEFQGYSLNPLFYTPAQYEPKTYAESIIYGQEKKSIQTMKWKLIYNTQNKTFELYNIGADPWEYANLIEVNPDHGEELKESLFNWMHNQDTIKDEVVEIEVDDELLDELRSLGYAV